jgi:hypothetical protein
MRDRYPNNLLDNLRIDYGPRETLGRFFLSAVAAARDAGVHLEFGSFEELARTNAQNRASWLPLLSTYDPACMPHGEDDFCILGRNDQGEVVATHAARIFNIPDSNFREHAETMRAFYGNASLVSAHESCRVTAPSAASISGRIYFGGAAWYHPNYRGRRLGGLLPRISRAIGLSQASIDWVVGIMAEKVVAQGLAARSGYQHVEWDMQLSHRAVGNVRCAVTWMSRDELLDDLRNFLEARRAQVDTGIPRRDDKQALLGAAATHR